MSSSNQRATRAAMDELRKTLRGITDDLAGIDKRVLTRAVNEGVADLKRNTPVGLHPNPVTFTTHAGESVSFATSVTVVGGKLRQGWVASPTKESASGVEKDISNNVEYASYWNHGHRITNKKGGPTKGFVKGTYQLEKSSDYVEKRIVALFNNEIDKIKGEYDV